MGGKWERVQRVRVLVDMVFDWGVDLMLASCDKVDTIAIAINTITYIDAEWCL